MKRVLAICLSALLILGAIPVSMVLADDSGKIVASVDNATVCPGGTVTLTVEMEANPGIIAWAVWANIDESVFEVPLKKNGTPNVTNGVFYGVVYGPNKAPYSTIKGTWQDGAAEEDHTTTGVLFTLPLTVKADAPAGDYEITLSGPAKNAFLNYDYDAVSFQLVPVTVTVGHSYDHGCDTECNGCGAIREGQHAYDNVCDADCNNCGAVRDVAGHSYTYPCDKICANCGELTNESAEHTIVHQEAVAPACHYDGNIEYWYCSDCGAAWADAALTQVTNLKSVILPAVGGDVVHMEAIEPGCHYDGQIEHWICYECEKVWTDEALTQLTNIKNVVLPAVGGEVTHFEAIEPGCHYDGQIEHWVCYECEKVWTDEALTQLTNIKNVVLPAKGGDVVHMEAIEPGCHYDGQIEHWICYECEKVWADEALTQLTNIKNVVLPATKEGNVVHMEAIAPACHYNGQIEHWICYECNQVWADEALTQLTNIKNVVLPAIGGDVTHVEAKAPNCYEMGNIEYWTCAECEQFWADEALTQVTNSKNVILPATHTNLVHMEAVEPACHYDGNIEYWVCYDCEGVWQDAALTQLTNIKNVVLPAKGGDVVHMEAIEPGCHYDGQIEHWVCYECEQVWADEALTQLTNIKNVVLPAIGGNVTHFEAIEPGCHYDGQIEHWICYECEKVWTDEALTQLTNIKNVVLPAKGGDVVHMEAIEPGCHDDGQIEHWICYDCEQVWADEALTQLTNIKNVVLPAKGGDVTHIEAVAPGCHYNGNVEYWICYTCEKVWADEALTQLTNIKNVVLPATGGDVTHFEAIEPGCHYDGQIEHWVCYTCEQVWADEALTQLTNIKNVVLPAKGGDVVHMEAIEPGCHYDGQIEHWICYECEKVWTDAALTQLTNSKNVVLPAKGGDVVAHEAVEPGCHYEGNIAYWTCAECEQVWADEALTQLTNSKNVILPATGGNVVAHEAVEPGCHYEGNIAYWTCTDCEQVWADEALTQITNIKNVVLPAKGGDVVAHEAVEPGCHYEGNIAYWTCAECEKVWTDEALTQLTNIKNVILPAIGGEVTHVVAKDPTCKDGGNIEYWTCEKCEQVWADEALTQITNIKNVQTGTIDHVYDNDQDADCNECGEKRELPSEEPSEKPGEQPSEPMGENTTIVLWAALIALMAAAVAIVLSFKKKA